MLSSLIAVQPVRRLRMINRKLFIVHESSRQLSFIVPITTPELFLTVSDFLSGVSRVRSPHLLLDLYTVYPKKIGPI